MYTDPTGWQQQVVERDWSSVHDPIPSEDYNHLYNQFMDRLTGGGGGHFSNRYFYLGGNYYNARTGVVSFDEVYNNYILPNSVMISGQSARDFVRLMGSIIKGGGGFSLKTNGNNVTVDYGMINKPIATGGKGGGFMGYPMFFGIGVGIGWGFPSGQGYPTITKVCYKSFYTYGPGIKIAISVKGGKYTEYNWVQTANGDGEFFEDPKHSPNNGLFWSQEEIEYYKKAYPNYNGYFEDIPCDYSKIGFELTLVGKTSDNSWEAIRSFSWGYEVVNGNTVLMPYREGITTSDAHNSILGITLFYFNH